MAIPSGVGYSCVQAKGALHSAQLKQCTLLLLVQCNEALGQTTPSPWSHRVPTPGPLDVRWRGNIEVTFRLRCSLLCDLEHISEPLWASFRICKTKIISHSSVVLYMLRRLQQKKAPSFIVLSQPGLQKKPGLRKSSKHFFFK